MDGHQYVFGVHRDTANVHLHIAVNRVSAVTFKAIYPDRDFYKLDYAMRELELRFGWKHDQGVYSVFERDGLKHIDWSKKSRDTKGVKPTAASDMERHTDQESFFSYVRGEPRTAVLQLLRDEHLTWTKLHEGLAKHGLALRQKGQGFAVYDITGVAPTPVKASDMHEDMSKSRLVNRLGEYENFEFETKAAPTTTYDRFRPVARNDALREPRRQERAEMRRELRARYLLEKTTNGFRDAPADSTRAAPVSAGVNPPPDGGVLISEV